MVKSTELYINDAPSDCITETKKLKRTDVNRILTSIFSIHSLPNKLAQVK